MILLTLLSCFPMPHYQRNHPAINGTLQLDEKPLGDLSISFQRNSSLEGCPEPSQTTKSDDEGKFAFEETGEEQWFFIYGDRLDTWTICVELENGSLVHWSTSEFWGGPPEQNLACRVEEEQVGEDEKTFFRLICEDLSI